MREGPPRAGACNTLKSRLLSGRRGLRFIQVFLQSICDGERDENHPNLIRVNATKAYEMALKKYHGWVVQKIFQVSPHGPRTATRGRGPLPLPAPHSLAVAPWSLCWLSEGCPLSASCTRGHGLRSGAGSVVFLSGCLVPGGPTGGRGGNQAEAPRTSGGWWAGLTGPHDSAQPSPWAGIGRGAPVPTEASAERTLAHRALGGLLGDDGQGSKKQGFRTTLDLRGSRVTRLEAHSGDVERPPGALHTVTGRPASRCPSSPPACCGHFLLQPPPPAQPHSRGDRSPMGQSLSHTAQVMGRLGWELSSPDRKSQSPGGKHGHLWAVRPGRAGDRARARGHRESTPYSCRALLPPEASHHHLRNRGYYYLYS